MADPVLHFADAHTLADFRTFTARARANDDGAMRLVSNGQILAAYVCTLAPSVLGEALPTVLGLRTMALGRPDAAADADAGAEADDVPVDATVALGSVLDRLARIPEGERRLTVPPVTVTVNWAGVLPPRSGWTTAGTVPCRVLEQAAKDGIAEVARSLPERPGAPVISSARTAVWGRPLDGVPGPVAAGAAFGAYTLGFLEPDGEATVHTNGRWSRVSTSRGHVLVRAAALF